MAFPTSEIPRMTPNNISDLGLKDEDSGLRAFRGICSPWDKIKSFREAYKFAIRHAAEIAVGYSHALRIVEPDYETAQTLISDSWAEGMDYTWLPGSDTLADYEDRFDVPPFWKQGVVRAALYADKGDQMTLIPGHIWYTDNQRFEKEIHRCAFDIAGPETCDLSLGGGSHFCYGLAGKRLNGYDPERLGLGDDYCLAVQESRERYGKHANTNESDEFGPDCREWEGWGPTGGGERPKGMPHKDEVEFLTTGWFESPTGAKWTAGEMYNDFADWSLAYTPNIIDVFRALDDGKDEIAFNAVSVIMEAMGKAQFVDAVSRQAARDWMGVPADVDDARVMAGWISMVMQARGVPVWFAEFTPEKCVVELEYFRFGLMSMYPELVQGYEALFNGNVKTLVAANYAVDAEEFEMDDEDETPCVRFTIQKRPIGFRRQKPHLHDYDKD